MQISQRQTTWTIIPDKDTIKSADEPKYDTDKEGDGEVNITKRKEKGIVRRRRRRRFQEKGLKLVLKGKKFDKCSLVPGGIMNCN